MLEAEKILKKYWGYEDFRPLQKNIIESVLSKNNTLALLPTGGGKSICFQVPALMLEGVCVVVSPLIALMKDQVAQLNQRGISAVAIYSGLHFSEIDRLLDEAVANKIKFLYVSPERLKTTIFVERLKQMKVNILAIDEAHCISKWGYDFRPAYLLIKNIRIYLQGVPVIALTATATNEVRTDIVEKLELKKPQIFVQSFARPNLSYSVFEVEQKDQKILQIVKNLGGCGIIYAKTRNRTMEIAGFLGRSGEKADFYHAGLSMKIRSKKQDDWISDKTRVMVSTNAFGMGIDKADVRFVVHADLPENLEAYYQESGRAGRDNQKAYAVCLFNELDLEKQEDNLALKYPPTSLLKKTYQSLANFYKIAVGSETLETYDFDLQVFCSTFGLNPYETHFALKILENQGLIYLSDAYNSPPKLMVTAGPKPLFDFQTSNKTIDTIIKAVLRIYGGEIFSNYIQINEFEIAKAAYCSSETVLQNLTFLKSQNIIDYIPQKSVPQFCFLSTRQDAQHLSINHQDLEKRKNIDKKALKAIKNFALNGYKCRMQIIQDYFDEPNTTPCGKCDNCLKNKKNGMIDNEDLFAKIKSKLPKSIHDILLDPEFNEQDKVVDTIRLKIAADVLGMDEFGLVYLK